MTQAANARATRSQSCEGTSILHSDASHSHLHLNPATQSHRRKKNHVYRTDALAAQTKAATDHLPSAFWGISPLFGSLERRGASADSVQRYRSAIAELKGFPGQRCLTDPRPPAPFQRLNEEASRTFLKLTDDLVQRWRLETTNLARGTTPRL